MTSILRATALLSGSSVAGMIVGLFAAKAWALWLGPSGLGLMGLLQAVLGLAALITGMGVGAGLVRIGASALAEGDYRQIAALRYAAWHLFWALGGLGALILAVCRTAISQWMLGGTEHEVAVVLMGLALLFSLAAGVQTGILNAQHRVAALAKAGILTTIIGTGSSLMLIWLWREQGIAPALIANAAAGWLIVTIILRREASLVLTAPSRREVARAVGALLRFGGPYTASMLVSNGVQFVLPILVFHTLDADNVGYFRAASTVSVSYLGFLLIAMGQDYYPRVSAASRRPGALVDLVNQQHRLIMLMAVPIILAALTFAPYLVPLVYSPRFLPAVDLLEWYLVSDILKFASWTMGFVILTRSGSLTLFAVELVAGATLLGLSWLGLIWFGLVGLGIGFLLTYVLHYLIVSVLVRRDIHLVWTAANKRMLAAALLAALVIRMLPFAGLEHLRMVVALALTLIAGLGSLYLIWQEVGGMAYVRSWRPNA